MPYIETCSGNFTYATVLEMETATREDIIFYLESRGVACYDDEPTELLRETAIEDIQGEQ